MKITALLSLLILLAGCGMTGSKENRPDIPGKITFSAPDTTGTPQIFVINANGINLRQLTHFKNSGGTQPSWNPDGNSIVFTRNYPPTSLGRSIYIMNADGSNIHPMNDIPNFPVHTWGFYPQWSPDGSKIAFYRCIDCHVGAINHEIFVFNLQTDSLVQLTHSPSGVNNMHPVWSPDSKYIVFASNRDYANADRLRYRKDLYLVTEDGDNFKRLTYTGNATRPKWSPTKNRIAYVWNIHGNDIFIYKMASNKIIKVKSGLKFAGYPLWSSKGLQLLIFGRETANSSLEMRLIKIKGKSTMILQKVKLSQNAIGSNYDWYNEK